MDKTKYQLEEYKKFLLTRLSVSQKFKEYVEYCIVNDDDAAKFTFHKIMVHNWVGSPEELFETLMEYFQTMFVPLNFMSHGSVSSFYMANLNVVLKTIKLDFMFPFRKNMFSIDILFNDKTSWDFFNKPLTLEDIVSDVVSNRFNENMELNLSHFCKDSEFLCKDIQFYKLNLLNHFKILMLRMGRDTVTLNLSHNNLEAIPVEILNFFLKNLTGLNLSYNNITSFEAVRISCKIERLWLEGNPICENFTALEYVKHNLLKSPRLKELDGIPINRYGLVYPLWRNYIPETDDRKYKMLVEKFIMLYFTHYDFDNRRHIDNFYNDDAMLSITTTFDTKQYPHYHSISRNVCDDEKSRKNTIAVSKIYKSKMSVKGAFKLLPPTVHDPSTFNIDCTRLNAKNLMIVVDGVFKELYPKNKECLFQFRRSFILTPYAKDNSGPVYYHITNELVTLSLPSEEIYNSSFQHPVRNLNELKLMDPNDHERNILIDIMRHCCNIKKTEAAWRIKSAQWDLQKAIQEFSTDLQNNQIPASVFEEKTSDFDPLMELDL